MLVWVTAASAQPAVLEDGHVLLNGYSQELGVIAYQGASEFGLPGLQPSVQGVMWRDRNGIVSRSTFGLIIAVATAYASSQPKSQSSRSYQQGNYIVTETTTTYYSEAEKQAMRDSANRSIDGLFSSKNAEFDLQVFARDRLGRGDATGYKTNLWIGTGTKNLALETGFGFGSVDSQLTQNGTTTRLKYRYGGIPLRASIAVSKLRVSLEYHWNILRYSDDYKQTKMNTDGSVSRFVTSSPWIASAQVAIFGRLMLSGGATAVKSGGSYQIGTMFAAAARF